MINYQEIKEICESSSEATSALVDQLMYYAARRDHREASLDRELAKYKRALRAFDISNVRRFQAQYFTHCVFKKGGLINQYVKHEPFKNLKEDLLVFLKLWIKHPWRYSFSVIKNRPTDSFYEMLDVFTGEEFLLYSPGATLSLQEKQVSLWYNLISFNGACWQSSGPIGDFSGLEASDIHYFTSLLCPNIWPLGGIEIMTCVEKNPMPYFALMSATSVPFTFHKEQQMVEHSAVYDCDPFDINILAKDFEIEKVRKVYQLSLTGWDDFPHFSKAYYDESVHELHLRAMTEVGYAAVVKAMRRFDFDLADEPDFRVNASMIAIARDVLHKKTDGDPYEKYFRKKVSKASEKELDKVNGILALIMPQINAGIKPDAKTLAANAGLDIKMVEALIDDLWKKVRG